MRRPLPSIEHVARALLVQGAREAAIDLLEAALARGGEDRPRCESLLIAVRSRPHDRVSGPPLALDASLVETLAGHGRLVEAWAVTRGASVGNTVAGVEIAEALAAVMQPVDVPEPWRSRWMEIVATGSVPGITSIERQVLAGEVVPSSLIERLRIASRLLRGYWSSGATEDDVAVLLPAEVRRAVRERLDARDLIGALSAVRSAVDDIPGAAPVAMALARLIAATERLLGEEGPSNHSTMPLEGPGLALLQVRIGNFEEAERGFRRIVVERPADHVSRDRLTDLLVMRRALEPSVGDAPSDPNADALALARTPSPDWLDKRSRKASVEGWASSTRPRTSAPPNWSDGDESTSVIRPDEEAELHIKAGSAEKALAIYRRLVEKYPDRPRFRARLVEVEAMIAPSSVSSDARRAPAPVHETADTQPPSSPPGDATVVSKPPNRPAPRAFESAVAAASARAQSARREAIPREDAALDFNDATSVEAWSAIASVRPPVSSVAVRRIVRVG